MKRTITISILLAVTTLAMAQSAAPLSYMYDAFSYGSNNYYGTARSIALANAMTAVGGDMGSVNINPAGSAVATYGQFVISPGLTLSTMSSSYSALGNSPASGSNSDRNANVNLPNIAVSIISETGRASGVRNHAFGITVNQSQNYNMYFLAGGQNSYTSLLAEYARAADGFSHDALNDYDTGVSWDLVSGYRGRLFGGIGDNHYAGNNERDMYDFFAIPAALRQTYSVTVAGTKTDLVFNYGLNVSDRFFFGVNLGMPILKQSYLEAYYESPLNGYENFYICLPDRDGYDVDTYYTGSSYKFNKAVSGTGIYAKVGVIFLPVTNLRIGAAIQSPTLFSVTETMRYSAASNYENASCNASSVSPVDEWSFNMRSPFSFNVGAAYTFGQRGFLSVDYELTDYSTIRMSELGQIGYNSESDYFYMVNQTSSRFGGCSHSMRVGGEFKVNPAISIRAGYSFTTSPEKYYTDATDSRIKVTADDFYYNMPMWAGRLSSPHYYGDKNTSFSLGAGYSSPGAFFADIAFRMNKYPSKTYMPYYDYNHYDINGEWHEVGTGSVEYSPRVYTDRKLFDFALTLGWRF